MIRHIRNRRGASAALLFFTVKIALTAGLAGAQQPPSAQPVPTIQAIARLVYVDVVVRDGSGHMVRGLKAGDFRLSENKQPQQISLFAEHTGATTPGALQQARAGGDFSNLPAVGSRALNMVLFDLLDTDPADQAYARQRMIAFLRAMPAGKQVALFVLGNRLHMVQGFTGDSTTLAKAAESINVQQLNRTRSAAQEVGDTDMEAYVDAQATIPRVGSLLSKALLREDIQNMKARLDTASDAFTQLAAAVNGFPGRKNLFWLAGQFPSSTYYRLQALSTQETAISGLTGGSRPAPGEASGDVNGVGLPPILDRAQGAIADSQIAVYPISVLGVQTDTIDASQTGLGTTGPQNTTDTMAAQLNQRQQIRSVMNQIAEETGGEAFYGNNDISSMLHRGFEDSENYYTLAYSPKDHNWDGKYRKLDVSVSGGRYALSYRRGYFALPEQPVGNVRAQFQAAMRIESPPATMLTLHATPAAASGTLQLDSTLDIRGVRLTTEADGKRQAHLLVGLMAYPYAAEGKPTPVQTSGKLNLNLTPAQYAALLSSGVFIPQQLPLKPGKYVLRVGVLDIGTGRIGTLTLPVAMP